MSQMNYDVTYDTGFLHQNLLDAMEINRKFTVDLPILNQFENHYVFVYGTLKKGFSRSQALTREPRNEYCGIAMTDDKEFELVLSADAGFPVALRDTGNTSRLAPISGQLWLVPTSMILKLDRVEGNGQMYFREYHKVTCGVNTVPAFLYRGVNTFWRDKTLLDLPIMKKGGDPYHFYHEGQAELQLKRYKESMTEVVSH